MCISVGEVPSTHSERRFSLSFSMAWEDLFKDSVVMIEQKYLGNRRKRNEIDPVAGLGQKELKHLRFASVVRIMSKPFQAGANHGTLTRRGCACRAENPDEDHALVLLIQCSFR